MPIKTEREDPLGVFNIYFVTKQQKIEGAPFGEIFFPKKCNGNCPCQNFRSKNSFKSDVALKHAPDERPVKKADQKSEIAPRERRRGEKT